LPNEHDFKFLIREIITQWMKLKELLYINKFVHFIFKIKFGVRTFSHLLYKCAFQKKKTLFFMFYYMNRDLHRVDKWLKIEIAKYLY